MSNTVTRDTLFDKHMFMESTRLPEDNKQALLSGLAMLEKITSASPDEGSCCFVLSDEAVHKAIELILSKLDVIGSMITESGWMYAVDNDPSKTSVPAGILQDKWTEFCLNYQKLEGKDCLSLSPKAFALQYAYLIANLTMLSMILTNQVESVTADSTDYTIAIISTLSGAETLFRSIKTEFPGSLAALSLNEPVFVKGFSEIYISMCNALTDDANRAVVYDKLMLQRPLTMLGAYRQVDGRSYGVIPLVPWANIVELINKGPDLIAEIVDTVQSSGVNIPLKQYDFINNGGIFLANLPASSSGNIPSDENIMVYLFILAKYARIGECYTKYLMGLLTDESLEIPDDMTIESLSEVVNKCNKVYGQCYDLMAQISIYAGNTVLTNAYNALTADLQLVEAAFEKAVEASTENNE